MQGSGFIMGIFFNVTVVGWCLTAFLLFRYLRRRTSQQPDRTKLLPCLLGAAGGATLALPVIWYGAWFLMWTGPLGVLTPLAVMWSTAIIVFLWAGISAFSNPPDE